MSITINNGAVFTFSRKGGAHVLSTLDIYAPTDDGWEVKEKLKFEDVLAETEQKVINLPKGKYECRLETYIRQSLNGVFEYDLSTADKNIINKEGNVNLTPSPDDDRYIRDGFKLEVV
ncbi:hypothetical protein [Vibrio sp. WXL210]|uniref:hypothetical protein n=1 Tax=Vibrio sp. WXL210 TaxID=3450709 RepID=UPI003EC544CB